MSWIMFRGTKERTIFTGQDGYPRCIIGDVGVMCSVFHEVSTGSTKHTCSTELSVNKGMHPNGSHIFAGGH